MIWAILRHWRLIACAAALAGAFYGGYALCLHLWRVDDLRASNAALRDDLQAAHQTAEVMRAHYARQDDTVKRLKTLTDDINSVEGRDAPLSPYLDNASRRLWP